MPAISRRQNGPCTHRSWRGLSATNTPWLKPGPWPPAEPPLLQYPPWSRAHPGAVDAFGGEKGRVVETRLALGAVAVLHTPLFACAAHRQGEGAAAGLVQTEQAHPVVEAEGLGIELFQQDRKRLIRLGSCHRKEAPSCYEACQNTEHPAPLPVKCTHGGCLKVAPL